MFSPFLWMVDIGSIIGILFHIDYPKSTALSQRKHFFYCEGVFFMQFYNSNNQKTLTLTRRNSSPYLKPDMILPDNCHTISSETFFKRSIIRSVIFPYEMQQIGAKAFQGCSRLSSLEFPGNLQKIGIGAFSDCPSLEQVQIPAGLTTIPKMHSATVCA